MPSVDPVMPPVHDAPDPLEFTRLFVASQAAFHGFVFTMVHDRHAADDLVQDLASRLWRKFGEYDHEKPFVAWGLGFARLLAFEWRRKQQKLPVPMDDVTLQLLADISAGQAEQHDDRRDALRECLPHLTSLQRRALHVRYYEDHSIKEIAGLWKRTEMAVYKVLKRAHLVLLECMAKNGVVARPATGTSYE